MSSYINGVTDYIPQYQPFQPDYNFLANVLQTRQSKYDSNYKQLNQQYGNLLNSPMSRDDNNQQRAEFFKMIDGDIKKISGMDLSLQQNVDSANSVFDSFLKNKNMVHDMVYTKQLGNEVERLNSFKNCIDQEKCGGKYDPTAMQALMYKQQEYKQASADDAMKMQAPTAVPFWDIQEKVMKYTEKILGKDGAFGIQVMKDTGDKWVAYKNGELLAQPLQDLINNEFGNDPAIQEMYQTKAYVTRKNYTQNLMSQHPDMDENMAEDLYFKQASDEINRVNQEHYKNTHTAQEVQAKYNLLKKKINTEGTTGTDDLAQAFHIAGVDVATTGKTLDHSSKIVQIANSVFDPNDTRELKRQKIDMLMGNKDMQEEFQRSATITAHLTGQETWKENPYGMESVKHQHEMEKLGYESSLRDKENMYKEVYKYAASSFAKGQFAMGSIKNNTGKLVPWDGTSTKAGFNEELELQTDLSKAHC